MRTESMIAKMRDQDRGRQHSRYRRTKRRQRTGQLRIRMAALLAAACIFMLGLSVSTILSRAQAAHADISCKYFASIQIQPGDTLYSIALQYADGHYQSLYAYMEEVCLTNHLTDDTLNAGDYLVIPYYSTDPRR